MADIDVFGHKISPAAAVAIAGGSGLAIWFAVKQHKANEASSSADSSAIDPVTGLPYSEDDTVDPLTGLTYLAEAEQYGSVSAAEQAYAAESSADEAEDTGGAGGLTGSSTGVTTDVPATGYTTNAQWAAAVTAGLTDIGYSAPDVSAALGAYLGSLPETSAQAAIVNAALAEYGPPPVGSYTVILASSTTPTGGGGPVSGQPTGPVTGTAGGGPITVAPSGFRVVSVTNGDNVNLAWDKFTPPAGQGPVTQFVIAYGPTSGSQQYKQYAAAGDTAATVAGVGAGSAGKHYFELWADPANTNGPHAGPIEATTTKS
jgi:hypothetical protein